MTAPMPGLGEAEFAELMGKIDELVRKVAAKANELVDKVNWILSKIPPIIGAGIRQTTERFVELMQQIFRELNKVINKPGWPPTLLSHGNSWADNVGKPVSMLAGHADPDQSPALAAWSGVAADAYKSILSPQQKAITAIKKDMTDAIHSALTALSAGIIVFWGSIVVAMATLTAGIITALGTTATVVGAPAGPVIAVGACVAFIAALAAGSGTLIGVAAVQNGNLKDKLADYLTFKDGRWPISTADRLSDGTLRDTGPTGPDDTDWHVK